MTNEVHGSIFRVRRLITQRTSSTAMVSHSSPATLNNDVWLEILKLFRLDPADSIANTRRGKRETLLSLVLTSRQLKDLALPELWRTIWSVKHVFKYLEWALGPRETRKGRPPWVSQPTPASDCPTQG